MDGPPTIFQAIICNDLATVTDLVDATKGTDYVLNLKSKDELGRCISCKHYLIFGASAVTTQ